ncbi:pyruvate, phosphate dikinase [Symbiobacterium terraclitae]|uniref:pyruvate, phosphate dikinase n=1 Tax=Symbiobacterium terraclitae TaxID=557451 RepID=UPI0035B53A80
MTRKSVYLFEEGRADMRMLLGGKGANLAEMTVIGLPVPPGFTITTEVCREYQTTKSLTPEVIEQIDAALAALEKKMGKRFGDATNPLLVSVRSGAPVSMPGMMDTILNLGLNDETVEALARATNNPRFAWDSYRRFIQMFSNVVLGIGLHNFEAILDEHKKRHGFTQDIELQAEHFKAIVPEYKALVEKTIGKPFPMDPRAQLMAAINAVFESWDNPRAQVYRRINKIPETLGTAVNVQAMAFGNMGDDSATGVCFTRNPNSGVKEFYGEYLPNAQGEDVVAGIRTPYPISHLKETMPEVYDQLFNLCELLESHYKDMQDIEFTVERGKLYMLQCRAGKRTPVASIKIAVDLVNEGKISKEQAILRVEPDKINNILHPAIDPKAKLDILATGLAASPGAASGVCVFDPDRAVKLAGEGQKVIMVRPETSPDDIHGMVVSQGILTSRGGMTSHAAIVSRGMGKPCVVGCEAIKIDLEARQFTVNGRVIREGDVISIDGATGNVIAGAVPVVDPELSPEFRTLLTWADEIRTMGVRANADTPQDARRAREFGAEGIGLCRTEHMFGQGGHHPERMVVAREMILAEDKEERMAALEKLRVMQREDFYEIFKAMDPHPVTIRLLDPPLHEFLPDEQDLAIEVALLREKGGNAEELREKENLLRKVRALSEMNPMLGFRGCRLGMIYPEIYEMQVRAIFEAAAQCNKEGMKVEPEVMHPLVGIVTELAFLREMTDRVAREVMEETGVTFKYMVGTMIEVPRAAVTADEIAEHAQFFSFGTNDLTQTTFGFSRDDAEGKFLAQYVERKVLPENPFVSIDRKGVGKMVEIACELGRKARPEIKLGVCGEHGGDPASIEFFQSVGLTYVSCSPYRVPVARLAAAQAAAKAKGERATSSTV